MSQNIDLGGGHFASFVEVDGKLTGVIEQHYNDRGAACMNWLPLRAPGDTYKRGCFDMIQREPLTLTPPIRCSTCGLEGRITHGRWVPV